MIKSPSSSLTYVIHSVRVALRYRMMVFTASVGCREGLWAKQLTTDVAKAMSSLVSTIENISDPVIPWYRPRLACVAFGPSFGRSITSFLGYCMAWRGQASTLRQPCQCRRVGRASAFFFCRSLSTFRPRSKLIAFISIISNAADSSLLTISM